MLIMLLFNVVMYLLAVCLNKHQVVFYVQIKCNTVIQMNYNFQGALLYFGFSEVQKFPKIPQKIMCSSCIKLFESFSIFHEKIKHLPNKSSE